MNDAKYIGMDVHTATISAAVRDSSGSLVMEATLETKAETILEFVLATLNITRLGKSGRQFGSNHRTLGRVIWSSGGGVAGSGSRCGGRRMRG
jgi:hypothetical protein